MLTSSRSYTRPYRPRAVRAANLLLRGAKQVGLESKLDERQIVSAAQRLARRRGFADAAWRPPLRRLIASIEAEGRLHPVARLMARRILSMHLANRLRIEAMIERHPEIPSIPVTRPVFIVGLQRTGTTLLQRLLALHPELRALRSWEAAAPAPLADAQLESGAGDPRVARARLAERGIRYMAPDFYMVHPVVAEGHEEDSLLFDPSLVTTTAEALMNVPAFTAWMEGLDPAPAYAEYRRVVQVLLWQSPGRWLGKTPLFLENLETLLATFPGALVVHTHRDPVETVASLCSMLSHGRGFFSDQVDPHEVGRQWLAKTRRMVERGMAARESSGESDPVDVYYSDLVDDPVKQVRRICEVAGLDLTPAVEERMRRFLDENPQHAYGRHTYTLEDFGLSRRRVEDAFAAYRSRFSFST